MVLNEEVAHRNVIQFDLKLLRCLAVKQWDNHRGNITEA